MTADRSLLRVMAAAQRELTLALEERKRARRASRRAEDRVRAARRRVRLVLQSAEPVAGPPRCEECGATLGAMAHCVTCAAARVFFEHEDVTP
jgi:hypothetical protein